MNRTIVFINNPDAVIPVGGINYDESIGLNIKNFGADIGGNWNEPDINYAATGTVDSNLSSLNDGSDTGISCSITDAAPSSDISGDGTSSTTNFPAGAYQRGARSTNTDNFALTFSGFNAGANVKAHLALFVSTSVFATENGTARITDGEGATLTEAFNCTSPTEITMEGAADDSGDFVVSIETAAGATNGVGLCAVKLEYVS